MTILKKLALVAALAVSAAPAFAAGGYTQTSASVSMSRALHHAKRAVREDNAYDAQAYEPAQASGPGIDLSILSQH